MNHPIEQSCIGQKIVTFPHRVRVEGERGYLPRSIPAKPTKPQHPRFVSLPEYYDETNFITQILSGVEQPYNNNCLKQYEQNVKEYYMEVLNNEYYNKYR